MRTIIKQILRTPYVFLDGNLLILITMGFQIIMKKKNQIQMLIFGIVMEMEFLMGRMLIQQIVQNAGIVTKME